MPTEASLARAEKRAYEPAEVLLARILKERRRRWEEAELARLKATGKTPKDDKWKAKYEEPAGPGHEHASGTSRGMVLGQPGPDLELVVRRASSLRAAEASRLRLRFLRVANIYTRRAR